MHIRYLLRPVFSLLLVSVPLLAAEPLEIQPVRKIGSHRAEIEQAAFADGGRTVIGMGYMGNKGTFVRGWNVDTRELKWELPISSLGAVCPDGKTILDEQGGKFILREVPSDNEIRSWPRDRDSGGAGGQKFSTQGDLLVRAARVAGSKSGLIGWDLEKGEVRFKHGIDCNIEQIVLLSDNQRAAVLDPDGGVAVFDLKTGERIKTLDERPAGTREPRNSGVVTADGKLLLLCVSRKEAEIRSQETYEVLRLLPREPGPGGLPVEVKPVAVIPGTSLVLDDSGGQRIWNYETGVKVAELKTDSHYPRTFVVSPDGRWLASGDVSGNIFIWDLSPLHKSADKPGEKAAAKKKPLPPVKLVKRTWSSSDGKFKVKALLEKIDGENVQLRKEDDALATVLLARLSAGDKKYVESVRPQFDPKPETPQPEAKPAEDPFVLTGPAEPPKPAPPVGPSKNAKTPELSKVAGVSIRRSESQRIGGGFGERKGGGAGRQGQGIEASLTQAKLGNVLKMLANDEVPDRVFGIENLPQDLYDVDITTDKGQWAGATKAYCEALEQVAGVKARFEEREVPVLVLRSGTDWDRKGLPKALERGGYSTGPASLLGTATRVDFKGDDLERFAKLLETVLKQPVFNESKIEGFFSAKWDFKDPVPDTTKYLADHGLLLTAEKRKVLGVFIEKGDAR